MFCPCGRSHKKWIEEQGLVKFMQKDMRKRQLCRLSTFSSGERLFEYVAHEKVMEAWYILDSYTICQYYMKKKSNHSKNVKSKCL